MPRYRSLHERLVAPDRRDNIDDGLGCKGRVLLLQDLKTIAAVEIQFYNTHNRTFGTFDQLIKDGVLDTRFAGNPPSTDGYVFTLKVVPKSPNQQTSYTLNADPQSTEGLGATGKNHFYIDSTAGTIHVNADQTASATDPPLGG